MESAVLNIDVISLNAIAIADAAPALFLRKVIVNDT